MVMTLLPNARLCKAKSDKRVSTRYNGNPIPKDGIAQNVLSDMGVPDDRTSTVLALITERRGSLGLITEIKGKRYVDLEGVAPRDGPV